MEAGVLVIGGGGHALVSIEVLRGAGHHVVGCLTREGTRSAALDRIGVDVVGSDDELATWVAKHRRAFVAIGDNHARRQRSEAVVQAGGSLVRAVSRAAVVSETATVGDGVLIMPGAVVNALADLETGVIVNTHASVDHGCRIGAFAHVAPAAALAGDVTVGEGTLVGMGASVVPGRCIGAWATVGAGASVVGDVAPGATVAGVPARPLRRGRS